MDVPVSFGSTPILLYCFDYSTIFVLFHTKYLLHIFIIRAGSDISKTSSSTRGLIKLRGFSVKSDSDSGIDGDSVVGEIRIKQARHPNFRIYVKTKKRIKFLIFLVLCYLSVLDLVT